MAQLSKNQALVALLLLSVNTYAQQSAVNPASPQSANIDWLMRLMFYVFGVVFVLVMIQLGRAVFRKRQHSNDHVIAVDARHESRLAKVVTAGVIGTMLILLLFLVLSFVTGRRLYRSTKDDTPMLTIEIKGHQWWWEARYLNNLPSQVLTTANEIHVPVGQPVLFRLSSSDVIHSFWVPNLHGKTDLIPGHLSETVIRPEQVGTYRGQCAEFCGYQHAHMAFKVIVQSQSEYTSWYQQQLQSSTPPLTASQQRGQKVFLTGPCLMCHRIQGTDAGGIVGPDLTHVASRSTIAAGTLSNTREHLTKWIVDAQSIKPGNRMPPVPLESNDLEALLDYLQSLQ